MESSVEGIVVVGDQRGRSLGFPTANVRIGADVELADGVYAGVVELPDGARHAAAVSVGRRPQYYRAGERLLEAYLLDFDGDLYGKKIQVVIGQLVRGQRSFVTEAELVEQIASDVEIVRSLQAGAGQGRLGTSGSTLSTPLNPDEVRKV
jgi:FAD synthase